MSGAAATERYDVVVVGGGITGIIAAVAAARNGARTCLVEQNGYVGGTIYTLGNVVSFHNNRMEPIVGGIPQELVDRMSAAGGALKDGHVPNPGGQCGTATPLESETLNYVALGMLEEAGVDVLLHSSLTDTVVEGRTVTGVEVANKSGRSVLPARVVVDASGDADAAARADAPYHQDVPQQALSATLMFRVGAVDTGRFVADLKRHPERALLLEDPYLREVCGRRPEDALAHVESLYDVPYLYLANLVRDYIPRADWRRWEIDGTEKAAWGRLRPFEIQCI